MPRSANWAASLLLTGLLVTLIAVAVAPGLWFLVLQIGAVIAAAGAIHWMFPGTPFFAVALANFIAIYTCLFVFFWETNFREIHPWAAFAGYGLPLVGFLAGAWWQRQTIRKIVGKPRLYDDSRIARVFVWLLPMIVIGGITFLVPTLKPTPLEASFAFIAAMTIIALTVVAVSAIVAAFLIESGLLFEEFFTRSARILVPAFAFLTFYSLIVVVFAALYRILDRLATVPQFIVQGVAKELSFTESLYFSLVTLATVGYGDIIPATNLTRMLAGFEVVCGVLLLLFGVNEIIAHTRAGRGRDDDG
jgi:voltage-gated potassium channel